jgi:hypothetical protein
VQKYEYVPGWVKVYVNVVPCCIVPESNAAGDGVLEVTVCGTASSLVHVTLVPDFTVIAMGLNSRFFMETAFPAAAGVAVA